MRRYRGDRWSAWEITRDSPRRYFCRLRCGFDANMSTCQIARVPLMLDIESHGRALVAALRSLRRHVENHYASHAASIEYQGSFNACLGHFRKVTRTDLSSFEIKVKSGRTYGELLVAIDTALSYCETVLPRVREEGPHRPLLQTSGPIDAVFTEVHQAVGEVAAAPWFPSFIVSLIRRGKRR